MDNYERGKLCDAVKEDNYKKGETVIKEGNVGNEFFIVVEGEAIATKVLSEGD